MGAISLPTRMCCQLPSAKRLQLTVTTREPVARVGFTEFLPRRPERVVLGAAVARAPQALVLLAGNDPALRVVLTDLAAGETRVIDVDLL